MSNRLYVLFRNCFISTRLYIIRKIRELNFFSDHPFWSPSLNHSEQILSTRIFLLFLFISFLIIFTYTSLIIRTHSITLKNFTLSQFEQIQIDYPTTINIRCTKVSNPYYKFISLFPLFHPICSSIFISKEWISSLFLPNLIYHNVLDIRTFTFAQFQSLALLCNIAYQSVNDELYTFNSTHLITGYVLSRIEFNEIINVLINNFQTNLLENEKRMVKYVSLAITQNGFMSALRTNFYIQSKYPSDYFLIYSESYLMQNGTTSCNCRLQENQCTYPAEIFYNLTLSQIPGLMAGCLPMESLKQSTLECLYNQSCINILSLQPNISHPKPLEKSSSRFSPYRTIGSIFDESLFIESWNKTFSYENYYNLCAPRLLTYTYQGRFRIASIFTICISAFGGLVILWQMIIPIFIKILKKQQKQLSNDQDQIGMEQSILNHRSKPLNRALISYIYRRIKTFNLFPSNNKNDIEEEYIGIISTRLYIFFLLLGLIILSFYTSLVKRNQTYTIPSPSIDEYIKLKSVYSSNFICSCSHFSMSYGRIISISPRYHSICSSEFIKKLWLSYFDLREIKLNTTFFIGVDFRISGQAFFNIIRDLCQLAKETVENSIYSFQTRRLISVNILSYEQFHEQIQIRLKQFEQETQSLYINLPELLRSSFHINHLVTNLLTSAAFSLIFDNQTLKWIPIFYPQNIHNSSCSCAFSSQCVRPQGFYYQSDSNNLQPKILIPGLVIGCYTIDSILLSNLECLFDKTCLQLLINMYHFDAIGLLQPLDIRIHHIQPLRKNNTRFHPKTKIGSIVSQLFIEDWGSIINFTAYYNRCAPKQCTYSLIRRFDRTYIIAMMLGFYSGLSAILDIILPDFVRFIRRRWRKQQNNIDSLQTIDNCIDTSNVKKNSFSFWKICQSLRSLNLFISQKVPTNEQRKYEEIIATRIYLILFILCLITALLYAGPFSEEIRNKLISYPNSDTVNKLHSRNISTLSCPCSTVAISHMKFLSIIPEYHSICSSHYIKPSYLIDLFEKKDKISIQLATHYSVLSSLCQQANRIVKNTIEIFNARELISAETMTYSSFIIQSESLISTFISQIPSYYRRTQTFIIHSFEVNHLLNVFTNNWKLNFTDEHDEHIFLSYPHYFSSSNCTCATSFNCTEQIQDDIVSGCFPYDGFRLSKFQNISLGYLNDKLFIEKWKNQSNYTAYFQACHPLKCQYTLSDKNNPIIMLTTILGLYGGLIYALRLIVGQSLHAYRWCSKNVQKQQMEITSIEMITI